MYLMFHSLPTSSPTEALGCDGHLDLLNLADRTHVVSFISGCCGNLSSRLEAGLTLLMRRTVVSDGLRTPACQRPATAAASLCTEEPSGLGSDRRKVAVNPDLRAPGDVAAPRLRTAPLCSQRRIFKSATGPQLARILLGRCSEGPGTTLGAVHPSGRGPSEWAWLPSV